MVSTPLVCRRFVGRTDELAHLVTRRRAASDAKGGLVLVGGEPGIGKSRLVTEFMDRTAHSTARLARAECRRFAQTPLGPLDDALAQLRADVRAIRSATSPEQRLTELMAAFAAVAERRATVVVVEDLHWADPELIATLRMLARRAVTQRLLFVATYRDNELVAGHPNFIALGGLLREPFVSRIVLKAFDAEPMLELLTHAAGEAAGVSPLVLQEVARRSDGNPLFGEELLRHAVDVRRPDATEPAVPISLHAVVQERLERCTPRQRRLLIAAALCGRRFDLDLLTSIVGGDAEVGPAELEPLVELQLLRRVGRDERGFEFRHALTRDAIAAERSTDEARPLHVRIAAALAERPDADDYAAEIAYHRWSAGEREEAAVASYEAAARAARAQFAWDASILWYERAVAACAARPAEIARVTLELGKVAIAAHDIERAADALVRVSETALAIGDVSLAVRARKLHAGMMANNGRREAAIALLERTLELVASPAYRAIATELVVRITSYQLMKQSTDDARGWLDRIDPATIDGSEPVAAEFYTLRATLRGRDGDADGWRADFGRALQIYRSREAGMFERYLNAEFGMQAIARGDLLLARQCFERAREASSESASSRNDVPLGMTLVELHAGRLAMAASWLGRVEPSEMLQSRMLAASAGAALGVALADEAMMRAHVDNTLVDELAAHDDDFGFIKTACAFAEALIALGQRSTGDGLLERAAARVATTFDLLPAIATIGRLRPDLVGRCAPLIARRAGDPFHDAALALVEAERFAAGGNEAPARRAAAAAHDGFAKLGWTLLAARAAELAGNVSAAFAIYRDAGHVAGSRRLGRVALGVQSAGSLSVLSARERELARMVAAGKSNRAAADALAISEKTVEKHLTSIYAKLSLQSRAQLTAYVMSAEAEPAP